MTHKYRVGDAVWVQATRGGPWLPGYVRRLGYAVISIARSGVFPQKAYDDAGWIFDTIALRCSTELAQLHRWDECFQKKGFVP